MVDSTNLINNFHKTIDQLLFDCANMKASKRLNFSIIFESSSVSVDSL